MKKKTVFTILGILVLVGFVLLYVCGPVIGEMPLWMSILPPLVAIVMALLIKEVLLSLFFGILSGAFIMALYAGSGPFEALFGGIMRVVDTYIVGSVFDLDHVKIIVFTVLIGGMVRIITINGGMQGVVN